MNLLENFESIPVLAVALLPGYVWLSVKAKFRAVSAKGLSADQILPYLATSLFCVVITVLIFWTTLNEAVTTKIIGRSEIVQIFITVLGVAILGGAIHGLISQSNVVSRQLAKWGFRSVSASASGWDRAFERKDGCLVRVERKDGSFVWGTFGKDSCASINCVGHDCYFEKMWIANTDGSLAPSVGSVGIWVAGDDIREVRFYHQKELESDESWIHWSGSSRSVNAIAAASAA